MRTFAHVEQRNFLFYNTRRLPRGVCRVRKRGKERESPKRRNSEHTRRMCAHAKHNWGKLFARVPVPMRQTICKFYWKLQNIFTKLARTRPRRLVLYAYAMYRIAKRKRATFNRNYASLPGIALFVCTVMY